MNVDIPARQVEVTYDESVVGIERMKEIEDEDGYTVASVETAEAQERRHSDKERGAMATTIAKDPICGMDVDPNTARHTSEYEGQTYYFCSPACKKAFDADPRQHLGSESSSEGARRGCCATP